MAFLNVCYLRRIFKNIRPVRANPLPDAAIVPGRSVVTNDDGTYWLPHDRGSQRGVEAQRHPERQWKLRLQHHRSGTDQGRVGVTA